MAELYTPDESTSKIWFDKNCQETMGIELTKYYFKLIVVIKKQLSNTDKNA